jgi:hypothetical protein
VWYEFTVLGKGKKQNELLVLALANDKLFPILGKLLSVVSVLPVSIVCCEIGFSQMNLVKNNFRSSLQSRILSELMVIKMNGRSLTEFNPEKDQCSFSSKTSRHVNEWPQATK